MSDLRTQVIKLAFENPELRKDLLPLLTASEDDASWQEEEGTLTDAENALKKMFKGSSVRLRVADALPADFLERKVKNPETGNDVKVKTLKNKPSDSKEYGLYRKLVDKFKGKGDKSKGDSQDPAKARKETAKEIKSLMKSPDLKAKTLDNVKGFGALQTMSAFYSAADSSKKVEGFESTLKSLVTDSKDTKDLLMQVSSKIDQEYKGKLDDKQSLKEIGAIAGLIAVVADQKLEGKDRESVLSSLGLPKNLQPKASTSKTGSHRTADTGYTNEEALEVLNTALGQLTRSSNGKRTLASMIGAKGFAYDNSGKFGGPMMQFKHMASGASNKLRKSVGITRITYRPGQDDYVLTLMTNRGNVITEFKGLYAADLKRTFEDNTGLYLSFR